MRWNSQASAGLLAVALVAGCNGPRGSNQNAGAAGTGSETGTMSDTSHMADTSAMTRDTGAMSKTPADTSGAHRMGSSSRSSTDSAKGNQRKSGVRQPVTSKGDTINSGVDSAH